MYQYENKHPLHSAVQHIFLSELPSGSPCFQTDAVAGFWFTSLCPSPSRLPVQLPLPVYRKELWVRDHSLLPKSLSEWRFVRSHWQRFHLQLQKWPDRSNVSDLLHMGNRSFAVQWWKAFLVRHLAPKNLIHLAKNNLKLIAFFSSISWQQLRNPWHLHVQKCFSDLAPLNCCFRVLSPCCFHWGKHNCVRGFLSNLIICESWYVFFFNRSII